MPRYIDAYKLYSRLIDAKHLFCKNQLEFRALQPNDKARVDEIDNLISIVINFPTADVVERKRGHWILSDDQWQGDVANGNYRFICSECGKSDLHSKEVTVSFCWNCGADMREEKTNED